MRRKHVCVGCDYAIAAMMGKVEAVVHSHPQVATERV